GCEPREIILKFFGVRTNGVERGKRVRDSILSQIVAGRHFSAKAVAAERKRHFPRRIRSRLYQHGNVQPSQSHSIGDGALVAEIRKRDDDAVDAMPIFLEKSGAALGFFMGLDRSVFAVRRVEGYAVDT